MIHLISLKRFPAWRRVFSVLATALALSGCSVLPESETLSFYRLSSPDATESSASPAASALPVVLRVATPYANRAVDSTRILVVPETDRISAYKGARWSDAAPVLVRNRLVEAFRASSAFRSVVTDSGNLSADLELSSELFQFNVVYRSGAPVVRVVVDATLTDAVASRILASRRFDIDQPVNGKEVPEVVQAFGVAVDALADQLLAWSREQAVQHGKRRP
ncbi:MAG TPA: ABC-type transport auxiliary lipoprotein family protein [Pusillimonas sp.]|uniref:ABC-type transport auxiliary lipoprotein family protein n=1 Tax=Pusillimonas sp. TaxID=3040095 RepID=UPI002C57A3BE|nr:ABC-type transport auxiliary lipoprotein family protein [Pusillimonas sp.]HUH86491.1 ABC-type transport auxiliary lipoprotein family protein [Pusillimonas sp.]